MRYQISKKAVKAARDETFQKLLLRMKEKGWGTYASTHETLGIITEEYHELIDAVEKNVTTDEMAEELKDIAVACIFAIACLRSGTMDW